MKKLLLSCIFFFSIIFASSAEDLSKLRANIESIAKSIDAKWGIYIRNIDTGAEININGDNTMETMSIIKIPIIVEAFRQIENGRFKLEDRVEWNDERRRWGTGLLQTLDSGMQPTVKDYLSLMISVSDNSATDMVLEKIGGPAAVDAAMRQMGFKTISCPGTTFDWFRSLASAVDPSYQTLGPGPLFKKGFPENPKSEEAIWKFHANEKNPFGLASPREIGLLIEMIVKGEAVNQTASKQMLDIMRQQFYMSRIPRYLPNPWNVPHKTGDFPPYLGNDAGVLEPGKHRIVFVVFNSHFQGQYPALEDAIARMALEVYNFYHYR